MDLSREICSDQYRCVKIDFLLIVWFYCSHIMIQYEVLKNKSDFKYIDFFFQKILYVESENS